MPGENRQEYLEAIFGLLEDGKKASTNEIAAAVGVKASSATQMLKKLHDEGLIRRVPYKGVELTERGLDEASRLKRKHRLLERFLYDLLGLRGRKVHNEACAMEHSLSDEAADALDRLLKHPKTCPDDHKSIPAGKTLVESAAGSTVFVTAVEGGAEFKNKMRTLGVTEGKRLRVVAVEPFGGPIVVRSGNTRVGIGRGMASKVRVV